MIFAVKLPLASLATIALLVFADVAVVAELETSNAVLNVTNLSFAIVPVVISAFTINEVDNTPLDEL